MRATAWQITLKNQATYSGADSARELLSVEQLGKSGWDCLSFLVLFELPGTSPGCCTQGTRQPWPHQGFLGSRCDIPCVPLPGRGTAIKGRHPGGEFRWARCDVPLFYGCAGPWRHREQSRAGDSPGDTAWVTQPGTAWVTPWVGGCSQAPPKPAKEGSHPGHPLLPLHFLSVRKSYLTRSGVRVPRTKPPLTLLGQRKGKASCEAEGKSMDLVSPGCWGCAGAECDGLTLLPPPWLEWSALLAPFAAGKCACETCARHLALLEKAELLSFRALTKPWAGLDGCCQVNSDLAKGVRERSHKIMANNP